jgi:hypothetical protein
MRIWCDSDNEKTCLGVFYPGTYEKGLQYAKDAEHTSHPESSQSEKEGFRKKGKRRAAKVYSSNISEGIYKL